MFTSLPGFCIKADGIETIVDAKSMKPCPTAPLATSLSATLRPLGILLYEHTVAPLFLPHLITPLIFKTYFIQPLAWVLFIFFYRVLPRPWNR